ncbi:hypothetical protein Bca52824_016658 [Brassica carinata]|uniref:Uncharacterized protein n=1 Tax=Brassica carinata TaxID=52824 RepID=A0A8X7W6U2_BRACI|nr:hypothetical protein Bca52824_016658 [Brassica carinata]
MRELKLKGNGNKTHELQDLTGQKREEMGWQRLDERPLKGGDASLRDGEQREEKDGHDGDCREELRDGEDERRRLQGRLLRDCREELRRKQSS